MRILLLITAVLSLASPVEASRKNTGGSTAQFLRIGAGARALGMGDAYGPIAEGPNAIFWNPAGLGQIKRPEVTYTHIEMLQFFHYDHIAYAHPVEFLNGSLGASMTFFYEDSQDLITNTNKNIGSFSNHSEVFAISYGRGLRIGTDWGMEDRKYFDDLWRVGGAEMPLRPADDVWNGNLLLGISTKLIRHSIHEFSATTFAADGGVLFRHTNFENLTMSFAFRNVGKSIQLLNQVEGLPAEVAFGLAYDHRWKRQRLLPALELNIPYYGVPSANVGVEYSFPVHYDSIVAFRAGYKTLPASDLNAVAGITGGVGFAYRHFDLNLGFQPMANLGGVYRIETGYRF
jgi:hypothetical protein